MRINTCSFCSDPIYPGHGNMYVRNDAKTFRYCTSKCDKNSKLKRNPRKTRWTKSFRKINGKELRNDPAFEFEMRRNNPVKYNREKMTKIVEIMKKVSDVRQKRENKFGMERLRAGRKHSLKAAQVVVRKHIGVLRPPAAGLKYRIREPQNEEGEQSEEAKKRNMESALKISEVNEEDETLPNLLQKKSSKEDDSDTDGEIVETKSKLGKKRIVEDTMEIDEEEDDDDESEEDDDESDTDME